MGTTGQQEASVSSGIVKFIVVVVVGLALQQRMPILFPFLLLCYLHSTHAMHQQPHSPEKHTAGEHSPMAPHAKAHSPMPQSVKGPTAEKCIVNVKVTWLTGGPAETATVDLYNAGEEDSITKCQLIQGTCTLETLTWKGQVDVKVSLSTPLLTVGDYYSTTGLAVKTWPIVEKEQCVAGTPLDVNLRIPSNDETDKTITVFNTFHELTKWAKENLFDGTGITQRPVPVGFPSTKTTTIYPDRILLNKVHFNEITAMAHEYGHWIRNSVQQIPHEVYIHDYCQSNRQPYNHAFEEGYANAIGVVYTNKLVEEGNPDYKWGSVERIGADAHRSLEHYNCRLHDMLSDEGCIGAFLLDVYDHAAHDDSSIVDGGSIPNPHYGASTAMDQTSHAVGEAPSLRRVFIDPLRAFKDPVLNILDYWKVLRMVLPDPTYNEAVTFNYGNLPPTITEVQIFGSTVLWRTKFATECFVEKALKGAPNKELVDTVSTEQGQYKDLFGVDLKLTGSVKYDMTITCIGWSTTSLTQEVELEEDDDSDSDSDRKRNQNNTHTQPRVQTKHRRV